MECYRDEEEAEAFKNLTNEIPEFGRSCVRMKDPKKVLNTVKELICGGLDTFQIIADFDHTITKQHIDGERHPSSFCVTNNCSGLPPDFQEKDEKLCAKYLPIERDPHMSKDEKIPHMVEFYRLTSLQYTGFSLSPNELRNAVKKCKTELRSGLADLVSTLDSKGVPFLVFSAGLGDIVRAILDFHGVQNQNIHIISNFLKYKDGLVDGFVNDIVHPFNKNGQAAEHTQYFEMMSSRHNIILMGDVLGDAEMSNGVPNVNVVLKIGFLYGDVEPRLPQYLETFDVVLIDDQTMDLTNAIVQKIMNNDKIEKKF